VSDRFSLSPHASTGQAKLRIVARGAGSSSSMSFEEMAVSRFWVEHVFDEPDYDGRHTVWDKLMGFAVVMGVCGGFWGGVGLVITHFLR